MHVRRALALAAALPLLVAGCSEEEPRPKMPDPAPSSSSSTPTAEPTQEQESPEEFIRRFFEADNEMQRTGDVEPFLALTRRCTSCRDLARNVGAIYSNGGRVEVGGIAVDRVAVGRDTDKLTTMQVWATARPGFYVPEKGAPRRELTGGRYQYRIELAPNGHSWLVETWTELGH